jgi:hypothetical protein
LYGANGSLVVADGGVDAGVDVLAEFGSEDPSVMREESQDRWDSQVGAHLKETDPAWAGSAWVLGEMFGHDRGVVSTRAGG